LEICSRSCKFGKLTVIRRLLDGVKKVLACGLPAQVEIIKACSDFEEPRALAESDLAGSGEVVSAGARVCMSMRAPRATSATTSIPARTARRT
jgi:hypothetical protein